MFKSGTFDGYADYDLCSLPCLTEALRSFVFCIGFNQMFDENTSKKFSDTNKYDIVFFRKFQQSKVKVHLINRKKFYGKKY